MLARAQSVRDTTEFSYQREKPELIGITKSINVSVQPGPFSACGSTA